MKALNIPKVSSVPALRFVLFFIFSATVKAEELNTYGESPLSDFFEIRNHIQIEDEKLNTLHVNQKEIVSNINNRVKLRRIDRYGHKALNTYAYVTLVTGSNGYALGALALGASLHSIGSVARRLCIITPSTSDSAINIIVASGLWEIVVTKDLICSKSYDIRCNKLTIFDKNIPAIQSLEKYIFIDADTYVKENLDHLFYQFQNDPLVGARNCPLHMLKNGNVVDACNPSLSQKVLDEIINEAISLDPSNFNSGLMVIDPKLVRKYDVITYASNWNKTWEGDQDPLNEIFRNTTRLSFQYNMLMCCQDLPRLKRRSEHAKMIHFSLKKMKPWDIYKMQINIEQGTWDLKDAYEISRWWEASHPFNTVYVEWTNHLLYALKNSIRSIDFEL